ncbi:hypothetical protein [Vibrio nigripulchritudo]|uniref:hypothetical protein n=1 Tax=Vibrio nigripulchritudo TaxID=28173 RepID=UPI0003B1A2BE|nr:hypothetical protein [Vibrio nigripulchritudo]CCN70089.1 hypothetical protein VIBNISFn118_1730011 [Vibrio nigripulchritudo SFn118]
MFSTFLLSAVATVAPDQTHAYFGETVKVCGEITEVWPFSKGVYLNVNGAYPFQEFAFVIWNSNRKNFYHTDLMSYERSVQCATGEIRKYKGNYQMYLTHPSQLEPEQ